MNPFLRAFLLITLVVVALPSAHCQTEGWEVYLIGDESIKGCTLHSVNDSLLILRYGAETIAVPIDSISMLRSVHITSFWTGAGYGALAGVAVGAVIGYATYSEPEHQPGQWFTLNFGPGLNAAAGGVVGLLLGGVIGGSVAVSSSKPDEIPLTNRTHKQRVLILGSLVQKYGEAR
jgi:outer membrane lipoprotein SlyB